MKEYDDDVYTLEYLFGKLLNDRVYDPDIDKELKNDADHQKHVETSDRLWREIKRILGKEDKGMLILDYEGAVNNMWVDQGKVYYKTGFFEGIKLYRALRGEVSISTE